VPVIDWLGEARASIDSLVMAGPDASNAARDLEEILADGSVAASAAEARMKSRGHGRAATKGAKARLRVVSSKSGMAGGWMWTLPDAEGVEGVEGQRRRQSTPSKGRPTPSPK
jgi:hypothetical protein